MPVATAPSAAFGLRLLERLGPDGVVCSPFGVQRALATVREGASGAARAALDEVLGVDEPTAIEVHDTAVRLALAQAIWVDAAYRLAEPFAAAAARRQLDCRKLDFASTGAPAEINAWAAEQTEGMIPSVVERLIPDEKLLLADALYFEGSWTDPFDPAHTEPRPFMRPDGTTVDVPTMHAYGHFDYADDGAVQAVRLPYGDDGELGFLAVVARDGAAPPRLDGNAWRALRADMSWREGRLALPRLRAESRLNLRKALEALGLGPAFVPGPDFDGLFEGPGPQKALGRVLQRARVDLDERGTRAAAVTVVTAIAVSAPAHPPVPFDLRLDRPFLWAIEHRASGTLLFLGRVTDPSQTQEEGT